MSEADLPANQQPPYSAIPSDANQPQPVDPAVREDADLESLDEEGWETIDFPNAISVNAIPDGSDRHHPKANVPKAPDAGTPSIPSQTGGVSPIGERLSPLSSGFGMELTDFADILRSDREAGTPGAPLTLIQALHECNRDLVQRVAQLEATLEEYQQKLQGQELIVEQQTSGLTEAEDRVSRLFSKLEIANQIIQRQEVLVETLTERVEASQTRLATLERECAMTQQRYNEQLQILVQSEIACRELRSRLHRQQRHTLQFKAALERCLEMPQFQSEAKMQQLETLGDSLTSLLEPTPTTPEANPERPLIPQSSPVQPWSAGVPISEPSPPPPEEPKSAELPTIPPPVPVLEMVSPPSVEVETYWHLESTTDLTTQGQENPFLTVTEEEGPIARSDPQPTPVDLPQVTTREALTETATPDWLLSLTPPLRAPKKRRSLAEIELPTFR